MNNDNNLDEAMLRSFCRNTFTVAAERAGDTAMQLRVEGPASIAIITSALIEIAARFAREATTMTLDDFLAIARTHFGPIEHEQRLQ